MGHTGKGSGKGRKISVFDLNGPKRATTFEAILHLKNFYPRESVGKIASWMMKSWDKGKG